MLNSSQQLQWYCLYTVWLLWDLSIREVMPQRSAPRDRVSLSFDHPTQAYRVRLNVPTGNDLYHFN